MRRLVLAALAVIVLSVGTAEARCRLALALALDVSGSVDMGEYRLQLDGVATALSDPSVQSALFSVPERPVALAIFEWSSSSYQRLILDWTEIAETSDVERISDRLRGWQRAPAPEATGLGAALVHGQGLLRRAPACEEHVLDVSGDGKNNDWPTPERLRAGRRLDGLRINGLVVARNFGRNGGRSDAGVAELSAYFSARIIQGPGAFVEVALGYEDYAEAMRRKLLRELTSLAVGALDVPSRLMLTQDQ